MMYNCYKPVLTVLMSTLLISCASSYNLTPSYDENTKTVKLGTYPIDNISYHDSEAKRVGEGNAVQIKNEIYRSSKHQCNKLNITTLSVNPRFIFTQDTFREILEHHQGNCHIEGVSTTYFMKCSLSNSFAYYITTSDSNTEARKKFTVSLPNETCMNDIKQHLLAQQKRYTLRTYDPQTKQWSSERKRM